MQDPAPLIRKRKRTVLALAGLTGLIFAAQAAGMVIAPAAPLSTAMLLVPLVIAPVVLLMAWRRIALAQRQTVTAAAVTLAQVGTMLWLILAALLVSALATGVRFAGY